MTSYSFNAIMGGMFYGTVGIGWTSLDLQEVSGGESSNETTYNFGGGVEIPVGPITIDGSGRIFAIKTADKASRKSLAIMVGANYYFNL
jgi:opacity protein-like surface antigen